MGREIERKFLVKGEGWRGLAPAVDYRQGYLRTTGATVRVRIAGEKGFLTIKGPTQGIGRAEFEYAIPVADARELLDTLCARPQIEKRRHRIPLGAHVWEVDDFLGENAGLVVAEIEIREESEAFEKPEWIGEEVSHDHRYANSALAERPFKTWSR
ncbi:MAG TPA: CYTH domain-containing protein [Myxococcales bacterium]